MTAMRSPTTTGARRSRAIRAQVDFLESRQLLSATPLPAPPGPRLAVAEVHRLTPPRHSPDLGTFRVDTGAIVNHENAQAKDVKTNCFFALQQIPPGAVSTLLAAEESFASKFGNDVQINASTGLHISVVRLGAITNGTATSDFATAEKYVGKFVRKYGDVNLHFGTAPDPWPQIKGDFVSYNLDPVKKGATDFRLFAEKLAGDLGVKSTSMTGPETGKPHISFLHYNSSIRGRIKNYVDRTALPALTLNFSPSQLVLMENVGNHQYEVATVHGKPAVINIQPR
jgi:hypothetical protein